MFESFISRASVFFLIAHFFGGSFPLYALRPELDRAGVEERLSPGGESGPQPLDESWIRNKALELYIGRRIRDRERALRKLPAIRRGRAVAPSEQEDSPSLLDEPPRLVPDTFDAPTHSVRFDPAVWIDEVDQRVEKLWEHGMAIIPIQGGEAVLFLRGRQGDLMLDFFIHPEGKEYRYIGRFDLEYHEESETYVAKRSGDYRIGFNLHADEYRREALISQWDPDSPLKKFRAEPTDALFVDRETAESLGLQPDVIQDALIWVAIKLMEHLNVDRLQVSDSHGNVPLQRLNVQDHEVLSSVHTVVVFERGILQDYLIDLLYNARPEPLFRFGIEPERWIGRMRTAWDDLKEKEMATIDLSGGHRAILLVRQVGWLHPEALLLDLFLQPKGGDAQYAGRLDLRLNPHYRAGAAEGAYADPISFSEDAGSFLKQSGIPADASRSPVLMSRKAVQFRQKGLYVEERTARKFGIPVEDLETVLTWTGLWLLGQKSQGDPYERFHLHPAFDNPFLKSFFRVLSDSFHEYRSMNIKEAMSRLEKRMKETAGLEEDEELLQRTWGDPDLRVKLERDGFVTFPGSSEARVAILAVSTGPDSAPRIYLQEGLEVPATLPVGTQIVPLAKGLEEVLQIWRSQPPGPTDAILFNSQHTPGLPLLYAWIPLGLSSPAVLRGNRETYGAIGIALAAQVARRLGHPLDLETARVTFLQVGSTLYAIVRSA